MRNARGMWALGCILAAAMILPASGQSQSGDVWYAWSPKPDKLPAYGKNKPVTRLKEVLAKHKGQPRWSEQVILTKRYDVKWIQAAPGDKSPTIYWGDDRVVWVVWDGQIRFNIQGQAPFVASKGFLVQVPLRVPYSMETVGNEPSLRFEITRGGTLAFMQKMRRLGSSMSLPPPQHDSFGVPLKSMPAMK